MGKATWWKWEFGVDGGHGLEEKEGVPGKGQGVSAEAQHRREPMQE